VAEKRASTIPSLTPDSRNPPSPDRYPVLLVEDDAEIGRIIITTLKASGYRVTRFPSAEDVLEYAPSGSEPFILLADVRLPGMDGLALTAKMRDVRDDFDVVVVTAHADVESLARAIELGIFRCLAKPFALPELRLAVAGAANRLFLRLDRRRHIAELERRNAELMLAMAQLRQSESRRMLSERLASIGRFAASLAHEINNPLAYVSANMAYLRENSATLIEAVAELSEGRHWSELQPDVASKAKELGAELGTLLDECHEGVTLIRQISDDLRSVARYRSDTEEVFDFNDVVRTACRVARIETRFRAKLEFDLAPGRLDVRGSTGRLAQVVMNLVANAAEANDPDRQNTITVRTRQDHGVVRLDVSDHGVGMTDEQRVQIFEPFVTFKVGGTGVGLAMVHEIVSECGGEIQVESAPGVGSTFRVQLPAAGVATQTHRPPTAPKLPDDVDILIVEDDAVMRRAYERAFRGRRLRFAENGELGLRAITEQQPDILVTDLLMPEMDGLQLFEIVGERWPTLARRVIFVTGTDSLLAEVQRRAPETAIVRKPFEVRELELLMLEALRRGE
jgi:signal transduction histidine kinase